MESRATSAANLKLFYYKELMFLKQNIPNGISSVRLFVLPHLVYAVNHQFWFVAYALFLFSTGTDVLDGYTARKLNSTSKVGAYHDVSFDFIFITAMYLNFVLKSVYSPFILLIIVAVFAQFVLSNLYLKQTTYDPIGKYYGSLMFGSIGLTLLFPNQLTFDIVTCGIVISSLISLTIRLTYFILRKNNKKKQRLFLVLIRIILQEFILIKAK